MRENWDSPSPSGRGVGGEGKLGLPSPSGRGVGGEGKDAITHVTVEESFAGYTLLSCKLETGARIRFAFISRSSAIPCAASVSTIAASTAMRCPMKAERRASLCTRRSSASRTRSARRQCTGTCRRRLIYVRFWIGFEEKTSPLRKQGFH